MAAAFHGRHGSPRPGKMADMVVTAVVEQYDLGRLEVDHPDIYTHHWLLAFASRCGAHGGASVRMTVASRHAKKAGKRTSQEWVLQVPPAIAASDAQRFHMGTAANVVTEYAALVTASAQVARVLQLRCCQVTLVGDCGDYWLSTAGGDPAGLLEVSGTNADGTSLEGLFREKREQVLGNKDAKLAYVSVTSFPHLESVFCRVR